MNEEHAVVGTLVSHVDLEAPPGDAHERADLLAAYESGSLSAADAATVERWLAEDDGLRAAWLALRADDVVDARPARPVRAWMRPLLVAAAVLAAFGTWRWLEERVPRTTPTVQERLARRFETLRAGDAPWLQTLPTLTGEDVSVVPAPVYRDGLAAIAPRGRQLRARPVFRFEVPAGSTAVTVRVEEEDTGTVRYEGVVEGGAFVWPTEQEALTAGRYLWHLSARTPTGAVDATVPFEVAAEEERARMHALLTQLVDSPDEEDHLLAVVIALDHGFRDEAARLGAELPGELRETDFGEWLWDRIEPRASPSSAGSR